MFEDNKIKKYISDLLKVERQCIEDEVIDLRVFEQEWPSTSLGFEGIGGDMITSASTIVIRTPNCIKVFFNGKLAYTIKPNEEGIYRDLVYEDLFMQENAASVRDHAKRYMWPE